MRNFLKKYYLVIIGIVLFSLTRYFIITQPPYRGLGRGGYSDVKHYYERYANMWYYGLPPYLKQLYEYPPATIPLVLTPLILDQKGIGIYYPNYRTQIFIFDIIFFLALLKYLFSLKISDKQRILSIGFYIVGGYLAKDFFYDGIDLIFSGIFALALMANLILNRKKLINRIIFWTLFFLSVGIKLITLPLIPVFLFIKKISLKKEILAAIIGFIIVWGLPMAIFRSSLSVTFIYNLSRPFKYSSFPYYIAETVNLFTKTEVKIDQPPDFTLSGPYSKIILGVFDKLLPISGLLVIFYGLHLSYKKKVHNVQLLGVYTSLAYVLVFLLTSKVYSQPFPIWLIPISSILFFKNTKLQFIYYLLVCLLLVFDTTNILNLGLFGLKTFWYPLTFGFIRNGVKFLTIFILLILTIRIVSDKISLLS